jgi:hypothetical protein
VDYAQGFHIARPAPLYECLGALRSAPGPSPVTALPRR